jgi:hypothetical protein
VSRAGLRYRTVLALHDEAGDVRLLPRRNWAKMS